MKRLVLAFVLMCAALAAGIALGGGPLDEATTPEASVVSGTPAEGDFADRFATAAAPSLYAGRLAGQGVALVTLPGADEDAVAALAAQVGAAGGEITGRAGVATPMVAAGEKTLVDTLGAQLLQQMPALADPALSTYPRIGQLLGHTLASDTGGDLSADAGTVRDSLAAAGLVSGEAPGRAASLVVLVTGTDVDDAILTGLVGGLAGVAHGVVVVGPTGSDDLEALRGREPNPKVATVDGVEAPAGQVAATLALVRQITGGGGHFGASGIDGVAPLG